jgi:hypothetical protein
MRSSFDAPGFDRDSEATVTHETHSGGGSSHKGKSRYRHLLIMTILSFIAMYVLMYAMVNVIGNAHPNLNQFYMAGLMAASIVSELPSATRMSEACVGV